MRPLTASLVAITAIAACSIVNKADDPIDPEGDGGDFTVGPSTANSGGAASQQASNNGSGAGNTGPCGNGVVDQGEACDDGFQTDCGLCNADCSAVGSGAICGDGEVCSDTEACDDGFTTLCGDCNADCSGTGTQVMCGDGDTCPDSETCDDGDTTDCGTCNATCDGPGGSTVLLLADSKSSATTAVESALNAVGLTTTAISSGAANYSGTPQATTFGAVLLLVGEDYATDMPVAGQQEIVNAYNGGTGILFTEWSAYKPTNNQWATLSQLLILQRTSASCSASQNYISTVAHPIWTGLPNSFNTANPDAPDCINTGPAINGGTAIATVNSSSCTVCPVPGVVIRDQSPARIVQIAHTAAYQTGGEAWVNDGNLMLMLTNAAQWAAGCL